MQFVMATNNLKKRDEMERILKELGIEVLTAKQAGADLGDVEETGTTFEENAYIKAKAALDLTGKASIADDSGLMVDALNGEPGVYSARYGGPGATDEEKVQKLLKNIENVPEEKRTARFVSAICCLFPNGKELMVRGECPGKIAYAPAGEGGFGSEILKQADDAITAREIIKGKCLETSPLSSREAAEEIASQIGAEVVQVIGTKFILYRRNEKKPVIVLPKK